MTEGFCDGTYSSGPTDIINNARRQHHQHGRGYDQTRLGGSHQKSLESPGSTRWGGLHDVVAAAFAAAPAVIAVTGTWLGDRRRCSSWTTADTDAPATPSIGRVALLVVQGETAAARTAGASARTAAATAAAAAEARATEAADGRRVSTCDGQQRLAWVTASASDIAA